MKLLSVVHGYPPASLGGAEIYARDLARELCRQGHEVWVLARGQDPSVADYELRESDDGPVKVATIQSNFRHPEHWSRLYTENDRIDEAARGILDRVRPEALHVHHLSGLSAGVPRIARKRGIPCVFTLHDYGYMCPRGQLLRQDRTPGDPLDPEVCARCLEPASLAEEAAHPALWLSLFPLLADVTLRVGPGGSPPGLVRYEIAGEALDAVYAHPPTQFTLDVPLHARGSTLHVALGMSPEVFSPDRGEGVRFVLTIDGETRLDEVIDPKRRPEHRVWHHRQVRLSDRRKAHMTFTTRPESRQSNIYNWAAWGDPRIGRSRPERVARRAALLLYELALARHVLCPSRDILERHAAWGVPRARMVHSPYGLDATRLSGVARGSSESLRVGFLGSLIPSKGVHVLVDALRLARRGDVELHVWGSAAAWFGHEGYEDELRSKAEDLPVSWHGAIAPETVVEAFSRMDVLAVPSIWPENAPLVIQEAFLTGTPVVASDIGGIPELVADGVNGLLFPAGDATALAEGLSRLAADRSLLGRLSVRTPVRSLQDDAESLIARLR